MTLQVEAFFHELSQLQLQYGDPSLHPIFGAGEINSPDLMFIFMNPTAKNLSAFPVWQGIRAPWIGTKNVWKMFFALEMITPVLFNEIQQKKGKDWTEQLAEEVYLYLKQNSVYVTNFAKCTQLDARALPDNVFRSYRDQTLREIKKINPKTIVTFGNQVSSILLEKKIQVSLYQSIDDYEILTIENESYIIYPTFYPVGLGMRNIDKAIERITSIAKRKTIYRS